MRTVRRLATAAPALLPDQNVRLRCAGICEHKLWCTVSMNPLRVTAGALACVYVCQVSECCPDTFLANKSEKLNLKKIIWINKSEETNLRICTNEPETRNLKKNKSEQTTNSLNKGRSNAKHCELWAWRSKGPCNPTQELYHVTGKGTGSAHTHTHSQGLQRDMHKTTAQHKKLRTCKAKLRTCTSKPAQMNLQGKAQNVQGKAQNMNLKTCRSTETCTDELELARQSSAPQLNLQSRAQKPKNAKR